MWPLNPPSCLNRHVVVVPQVLLDLLARLPRHLGVHGHKRRLDLVDLLRLHAHVLRLPLRAAHRLVDHHARLGQRQPLAARPRAQNERRHRGGHADVDGHHLRADVLHRVVQREAGDDGAARRVDVEVDRLRLILGIQEEHHRDDLVDHQVVDLLSQVAQSVPVERVVAVDPLVSRLLGHAVRLGYRRERRLRHHQRRC